MELYTLDRNFIQQETIDKFESVIWTERYVGDGEFILNVEATSSMLSNLAKGQLMMCEGSDEPMILETREIKDGLLKTTGISLTKWLANRPIRTTNDHSVKEVVQDTMKPGRLINWLVQNFAVSGSYLDGTIPIGLSATDRNRLKITGLVIGLEYTGGSVIEWTVPFGPLYDAINTIATTYELGMRINLMWSGTAFVPSYQLSFNNWAGLDRTSDQTTYPVIRFSPEMDSFTNITDLESITDYKNLVLAYASNAPAAYMTAAPGRSAKVPDTTTDFDLRIVQDFEDFDTTGLTVAKLGTLLNEKAKLMANGLKSVQLVDGELVETAEAKFGGDPIVYLENLDTPELEGIYLLGDIIEVVGNTGVLQKARISEYIRSQDSAGERSYPTLAMIDP